MIFHCGIKDRHLLPGWLVFCPVAFLWRDHHILQAYVGEGATCHHQVIAAACAILVEVLGVYASFLQEFPGRRVRGDVARGGNVIGGDAVAELRQRRDRFVGFQRFSAGKPKQNEVADHYAGAQFAQNARLLEPFEYLTANLGRYQNDRDADQHPFIGYNYRISELHAAVGLAQVRRLPEFLAIQKRNHTLLKAILGQLPEVSFRSIPDPEGDSHTFLSWFLPTEEITRAVVAELKTQNILAGNFYWYDNNWHYIRKWDHLKNLHTLNALHPELKAAIVKQASKDFTASDAILSRCISSAISLAWTPEQVKDRGEKILGVVKSVLGKSAISV